MPDLEQSLADTSGATDSSVSTSADSAATDTVLDSPVTEHETSQSDPWADYTKIEQAEDKQVEPEKKEQADETKAEQAEPEKTDEVSDEDALEDIFKGEDDDLTDEQIRAQRKAAQPAIRRNEKLAKIVKDFQYSDKPVTEILQKFQELNPARFEEMKKEAAHSLVDANPEGTFKRAYAVKLLAANPNADLATIPSLDDVIKGAMNPPALQSQTTETQPNADKIKALGDQLTEKLEFDWRDPANDEHLLEGELLLVQQLRTVEADHASTKAEKDAQAEKLSAIEKELATINQERETNFQATVKREMNAVVTDFRTGLTDKLIPHIRKNTGLEVSESDIPEVKAVKEQLLTLYTGDDYARENGDESAFETFAFNRSSVKGEIDTVIQRVFTAQAQEAQARAKGDTKAAAEFKAQAAEENIPLFALFEKANREFKTQHIDPIFKLIGALSATLGKQTTAPSERVEIVGSSNGSSRDPEPELRNAEDIWQHDFVDAPARRQQLRANG